jgi:hypothetical protein
LQVLSAGGYKEWEFHTELTPRTRHFVYREREDCRFNQVLLGTGRHEIRKFNLPISFAGNDFRLVLQCGSRFPVTLQWRAATNAMFLTHFRVETAVAQAEHGPAGG